VDIAIEGIPARALLDTGATISVISESFYKSHLGHINMVPLDSLLNIECAQGENLTYMGYIEVKVKSISAGCEDSVPCVILVIPDTKYNVKVPVLLGTNILLQFLEVCKHRHGVRFMQTANIHTPWYLTYRCMVTREKELMRNGGKLGLVKSSEVKKIYIPGNSTVVIRGQLCRQVPYAQVCALLQPTVNSTISDDLDISPTIIQYDSQGKEEIQVHIANVTTQTLVVQPRATLCELQPVTIQDLPAGRPIDTDVLDQIEMDKDGLTREEITQGTGLILKFKDIFSKADDDLGHSDMVKHRIDLEDDRPFKQRHRRIPPSMYEDVKTHLQDLLSAGVIRHSYSPWASNIVLVKRKDGRLRMCTDYRQLNNRTIKDSYALPRIEEILDSLGGMTYFSVLDMKSGYHQVEVDEEHKSRTAFTVGPLGFYEYNRMPFGLANAPATYQRLMEKCLEGLHLKICLVYLDDLIIFSKTYQEHVERIELVLRRLQECNLKLAPKKCKFFKRKVKYVGYIVSADGIEADPEKVDKIRHWPTPTSPEEVRKFLGFAGYYRKFVAGFSQIARPLSELMPKTAKKKTRSRQPTHEVDWKWGPEQEEAFTTLKTCLTSPPVLGYADFAKPFELHTDASCQGLGAVLYQEQDGQLRAIAYASRSLNRSEKHYAAHKLEFLCLKWSISEKFHDYLYGNDFVVVTDNNPLTYILTTARLDATGHRWLAALANYNFTIRYRPGKANTDADTLSRLPPREDPIQMEQLNSDTVNAICSKIHVTNLVESLCFEADVVSTTDTDITDDRCDINAKEWRRAQLRDKKLSLIIDHLETRDKPDRNRYRGDTEMLALLKSYDHFKLQRGVLHKVIKIDGEDVYQLVLPSRCRSAALRSLHDHVGHPGRDRTTSLIRERFYWPGVTTDVEKHLQSCDRCLKRKSSTAVRAPLVSIQTLQPLELVCMDFLTLEPSKGGHEYVLVITDHFTRYAQAYPCKNTSAKTTADLFFNNFVINYGLPKRIHSDKGANFVGKLMTELCKMLKIEKSNTTPYHPMGNGMCERFNRTLCDMLGTLEPEDKRDWKTHIGPLVHAYNCTRHESTGQSPFYLMYGRTPRLPVDLAFGLDIEPTKSRTVLQYTKALQERLRKAYELAVSKSQLSQAHQKTQYDRKARAAVLEKGDRILVKIVAFDGRHKLSDKWEDDVYVILDQPNPSIPVYTVGKENGEGRKKILHRNLLLPVGSLPRQDQPIPAPRTRKVVPVPIPRRSRRLRQQTVQSDSEEEDSIDIPISASGPSVSSVETVDWPADESTEEDRAVVEEDSGEDEREPDVQDHEQQEDSSADSDEDAELRVQDDAAVEPESPSGQDAEQSQRDPQHRNRTPPLPPRRSARPRKPPSWIASGDYVMSAVGNMDWKTRADYLKDLLCSGDLHYATSQVTDTLLLLVSGK